MRFTIMFLIGSILFYHSNACADEIALTFDDAPRRSQTMTGAERTEAIVEALRDSKVPKAAFFVNTVRMEGAGKKRIRRYVEAGHLIANHSHSHPDLDKVGPDAFLDDIDEADRILSSEKGFRKWFRYPYLHEGKDNTARDKVRAGLAKRGYLNAYVSVDTYDWYLDKIYQRAVKNGRRVDRRKLCAAYSDMLWQAIRFYDDIALKSIERSPKHVLLLHENDVAAMCVSSLVGKVRENGWRIIDIEEAFGDPISAEQPDVLRNNQGRIVSIALSMGYKGLTTHPLENEKNLERFISSKNVFK